LSLLLFVVVIVERCTMALVPQFLVRKGQSCA
jgi:hypothetical protein